MSNNQNKQQIISVNSSSIVDLKAELLRKQEEIRQKKTYSYDVTNDSKSSSLTNQTFLDENPDHLYDKNSYKLSRLPKKVTGVSSTIVDNKKAQAKHKKQHEPLSDDNKREEDLALQKSRIMLEKKSKLYDQMETGKIVIDPEDSEDLLVNFEQKIRDGMNNNSANYEDEESDEHQIEFEEYEDEFGRTRLVPKQDLIKSKNEINKNYSNFGSSIDHKEWSMDDDLLSNDMKREIERRKWEDEIEQQGFEESKKNTYYQDVREGEIRDHGAAFYSFSGSEEDRAKQMEMLEILRKETESKKSERNRIKEKRKQMLKARLAKVAARKGIQLADDDVGDLEEDPSEKITIQKAKVQSNDDSSMNDSKVIKLRDWDIGKEGLYSSQSTSKTPLYSQERYKDNQREERISEFAPPQIYSSKSSSNSSNYYNNNYNNHKRVKTTELGQNDNDNSNHSSSSSMFDMKSLIESKISEIRKNSSNCK